MSLMTIDHRGRQRRCGTLVPNPALLRAAPVFEDEVGTWTKAEVLDVITDPKRVAGRKLLKNKFTRDQKSQSSCNAFATCGAYDLIRFAAAGNVDDGWRSSTAFCYSLMNHGSDNGSTLVEGHHVAINVGFSAEKTVPFEQIFPKLQPNRDKAMAEAAMHRGLTSMLVKTELGFWTALAKDFKCVVAVQAGRNYSNAIGGFSKADVGQGNHANVCVNAIEKGGKLFADTLNSWNDDFGEMGFTYLGWESFSQTIGVHGIWALASHSE